MAESDIPEVKVPIILDFSGLPAQAEQIGRAAQEAGEKGAGGFRVLGFASAKLSEELGVPFRAAHILGTRVEEMAKSTFPAWGTAFGVVGLAAVATAGSIIYLHERNKKLAEETIKAANAAVSWVDAARIETTETKELADAKDRLWQIEKSRADFNLTQGIRAEMENITKLADEVRKRGLRAGMDPSGGSLLGRLLYGNSDERKKDLSKAQLDYEEAVAKLNLMYLSKEDIAKSGTLARKKPGDLLNTDPEEYKDNQDKVDAILQESINHRYLIGLEGDEREEMQMRLAQQKEIDSLKELGASSEEIDVLKATHAMDWRQRVTDYNKKKNEEDQKNNQKTAEEEARLLQLRINTTSAAFGNMANAAKLMYETRDRHGRSYFQLYKASAISQTLIDTYSAATGAYKALVSIPYAGPALAIGAAAAAVAYGMAQVNAIRSQEYGSSGGSVGTYTASPATGLPPVSSNQSPPSQTTIIIQDGQGNESARYDLAEGLLKTIHQNGGTVGRYNIKVTTNA